MLQFSPLLWDLKAFTQTVYREEQPAGCLTNKTYKDRIIYRDEFSAQHAHRIQSGRCVQKDNFLLLVLKD